MVNAEYALYLTCTTRDESINQSIKSPTTYFLESCIIYNYIAYSRTWS